MKLTKQQYPMLDLGKFLCALLILFYHFFSEHGSLPMLLEEALSSYAIAVALFMVISGFLTFSKLEDVPDRDQRWAIVKKQALRIMRIYLIWSIVYIIYNISRWDPSDISAGYILLQVRQWIFGSTFYTIWFMPSVAIGTIAAFGITEYVPKHLAAVLAAALYVLGSLQLTYMSIGTRIPGLLHLAAFSTAWLGGPRGWLFFGFPLIMVGRHMAKYIACKKRKAADSPQNNCWIRWMILSVVSVFVMLAEALTLRHFCGSTGIDMTIMMPVSVFCILGFLLNVKIPEGSYLIWMRKMSVLIFLTQRIFLTVIPDLLPEATAQSIFLNSTVGFCFICGGTVLFSSGIIAASQKVKWLRLLY